MGSIFCQQKYKAENCNAKIRFMYSNAYIIVKGSVSVKATPNTDVDQKDVAFENNAPFRSYTN